MSPLKVGYARVSTDEQNLTAQRDGLAAREVKLSIAGSVYDPTDPMGKLLFNVLAMVAEFEADLIRARTREGMRVAKGRLRGKSPKLTPRQEAHLVQLHAADEHTVGELAELLFLVKSVFRVSSLIFFGFRHEECRPVVCFTGCPSCRT